MSESGVDILLRARTKFRAARTQETLQKIEVKEWDCTIYYWPIRSLEERMAVEVHVRIGTRTSADMVALHLAQVCHRSRNAFGERLFTDEQAKELADASPAVLEYISLTMGLGDGLTIEKAEKNS